MIELRLCSIDGARWLKALPNDSTPASIPKKGFGLTFGRTIQSKVRHAPTCAELKSLPAEGFVLAFEGPRFDPDFLVSAVQAAACTAIVTERGETENADAISRFVDGESTDLPVPEVLAAAGVRSCIAGADARRYAMWLDSIDKECLAEEVTDIHGAKSLDAYISVLQSLIRTLQVGTTVHECDICCLPGASQTP